MLEDLSQDSFDKKTPNVKQKVFLERRTHESRGEECLAGEGPCKTIRPARNDLESFESFEEERQKSGEGVDLDCYLQEELDKHEQNERQGEEGNTKSSRRIKGRCLPVVRCRQILPKERAASPATPEPKKVFRCNINNCSKTYVKSSHLKVINTDILAPCPSTIKPLEQKIIESRYCISCIRSSSCAGLACCRLFRHVRQCNPLQQERRKVVANLGNYEIKSQHLQAVPQNGKLPIELCWNVPIPTPRIVFSVTKHCFVFISMFHDKKQPET